MTHPERSKAKSKDLPRYFVYILVNHHHNIMYIGLTDNLQRRIEEHKQKKMPGFTQRYNVDKLVYYELYTVAEEAAKREKQLKKWSRSKKNTLVETMNSAWKELTPPATQLAEEARLIYDQPGDPSASLGMCV